LSIAFNPKYQIFISISNKLFLLITIFNYIFFSMARLILQPNGKLSLL